MSNSNHSNEHHELSFWQKYVFSLDHKVIGIQYGLASLLFLLLGLGLVSIMRWQLAYPGEAIPFNKFFYPVLAVGLVVIAIRGFKFGIHTIIGLAIIGIGYLFNYLFSGEARVTEGIILPEFYNQLGAMHGTIMIFLGVVPLAVGAFGNYFVPLQIGAPDMAFPKLNMASFWVFFIGGVIMILSFFLPQGTAQAGWTSYPPLSVIESTGQTYWLIGMVFLITSSLLGSVNFIVTIVQLRAEGLDWFRLPIFVWAQFITSFLLLLAFPPLEVAGIFQLLDRTIGTSFFMPTGLVVSGQSTQYTGGGNPVLYQHLFWFLAHPEVYVLILPAFGIIAEVLTNNIRKPLWGYKTIVYSILFLAFTSMIVWAHHMYITGMGTVISSFFQATTMIISIPSVVIISAMFMSLWGGSIRFTTAMLFALAFLPMFGIGGLTGLPLGLNTTDIHLHDTYYVIGHFHYVVAPGTIFALIAGIYHWYPKITGRMMNENLGKVHFWGSLIAMNFIFFPMLIVGMAGVSRRLYDGGMSYAHAQGVLHYNETMSIAAWLLALAQVPFIINVFLSLKNGKKVENDNPWNATTLEWATPTPPPHGNFTEVPTVYRGPYEYNPLNSDKEFIPQNQK